MGVFLGLLTPPRLLIPYLFSPDDENDSELFNN
jgi:hypothetical protein